MSNLKKSTKVETSKSNLELLNSLTIAEKVKGTKESKFKKEFQNKKDRSKLRKQLENKAYNICFNFKYNKSEEEKIEAMQNLKTFLENTYLKNDFKVESYFSGTNQNLKDYLKISFELMKENKIIA